MTFSFRLLRLLSAVANAGSVTRAARALGLTQPAVSKGLRALERQVGVPLFVRAGGRLHPTEAGAALIERARVIFAEARAAEEDVRALAGLERGRLSIGGSPTIADYVLPRLLYTFCRRYPGVAVRLTRAPTRVVAAQFAERHLDLALTEAAVDDPRIVTEQWITDELVPVAAPKHPLAVRPSLRALANELIIIREPGSGTRDIVLGTLRRNGIEPGRMVTADSSEGIRQIVAAGLGMAIDSHWAIADLVRLGRLTVLDLPMLRVQRPLYRLTLRSGRQSAAARAFGDIIASAAEPRP